MIATVLVLAAVGAGTVEPVLDGRCDDHRGATIAEVSPGVTAYVRQTADHVWLCFAVPEGSYATLDLRVEAPGLARPLNLHASAQLGEWPADDPAAAPANGSSDKWWRVEGWWGSTTPFNGGTRTPEGFQVNFRTVRGRELQLSKVRFGRGRWRLSASLADVANGQGMTQLRWPKLGSLELEVK